MDEVYDLHRHTDCVIFYIGDNTIVHNSFSISRRDAHYSPIYTNEIFIVYNTKKKSYALWDMVEENEDTVRIYLPREKIYRLFKKGKDGWDQDDRFYSTVVSNFIRLSTEEVIKNSDKKIKDSDAFHYLFVVPSEWEEEFREDFIRPLFMQADLLTEDDHQDRLLFCSDIECMYYYFVNTKHDFDIAIIRNAILGRIITEEENRVLIKLYSISIGSPLFDAPKSVMFPKIIDSNSLSLTTDDVINGIRELIKTKFSFDAQEETIQNIMEELGNDFFNEIEEKDDVEYIMKPFISDRSISELDKHHETHIKSIRPFDICAEISKKLPNNLKNLLPNNLVKEYTLLKFTDAFNYSEIYVNKCLVNWSRYLLEYNRVSLRSQYIMSKTLSSRYTHHSEISEGASLYLFSAVQNSDIYSKPRILPTDNSATSSSIFLNSKPDTIMNIDISLKSTALSFSFLDENGLVKEIWNHDYFVPGILLRSLGSFFSFSEVSTLNVKNSFITFVDKRFTNDPDFFSVDKNNIFDKDTVAVIEDILHLESYNKDSLVSTRQQIYIKAFVSIYWIYISNIVLRKLPAITGLDDDTKIGYYITIENVLLNRLFGTEDDLRDIIYASNLAHKDDSSKKLRIATRGERLFSVIQQSFELQFPLKSFFVVAQLYEDYIHLTLNQVVTESSLDEEDQEAIVLQDELIYIPNIYDSLCFSMWNNIIEDITLINLCDTHKEYNDNELLEIFSLENQTEFTNNLQDHISKNILDRNLTTQKKDTVPICLSNSCNCKVSLTSNDITEVSFRPVLKDIISSVFTSLINKQLFGKYGNIQYVFHMIYFNYNPQFQRILTKILNDETDYFLYERMINTSHYTIQKLSNELLKPTIRREACSYKAFQMGVLYHVYSETYNFRFSASPDGQYYNFKSKIFLIWTQTKDTCDITFRLFKKGDKISSYQIDLVCLTFRHTNRAVNFEAKYPKLDNTPVTAYNGEVHYEHNQLEAIDGPFFYIPDDYITEVGEIPFTFSIAYEGYTSSLSLAVKYNGTREERLLTALSEPMTLARF